MRTTCAVLAIFAALALGACSPTLNWREATSDDGSLTALFPCKPDRGTRDVTLGGSDFEMHMYGCEAEKMLFAVSRVSVQTDHDVEVVAGEWRAVTLENLQAKSPVITKWTLNGARQWPDSTYQQIDGINPDGVPVKMTGAWFSRGRDVFHAVIYAPSINPEVADTFFSGLKFK